MELEQGMELELDPAALELLPDEAPLTGGGCGWTLCTPTLSDVQFP